LLTAELPWELQQLLRLRLLTSKKILIVSKLSRTEIRQPLVSLRQLLLNIVYSFLLKCGTLFPYQSFQRKKSFKALSFSRFSPEVTADDVEKSLKQQEVGLQQI
jgi:hypothetical protein